ncbi:hypothetical protein C1J01_04860 [Nonomuraea aridisoli]|uniref:Winged helix-turn-helix domain-containing protein n=1 Tax=Nonomuraea aridisoli TaxID=2070368 RepID=A0A2W2EHI8_9ACTN|nr:hypothetical protein C1J01_04860 [Nonomuraea aridisoli]
MTGPGGVGKTRLALAVAATVEPPDGVWLVELAELCGGGLAEVAEVVAGVLGVRDEPATGARPGVRDEPATGVRPGDRRTGANPGSGVAGLAERLAGALRGRRMLLVLDNCEHLIEPVAELAGLLLRAAPGVSVLATSHEPLAIPGEVVHPLGPLGRDDAVTLFAARAGIALNAANAGWVASICERLDGIPLALELAAARVRTLGVRGVAERLDDRFALLAATTRGLPARQRTLRAVIDWSWDQLDQAQRAALCALAVHPGGCTLQAAEAVGVDLGLLDQLVNRSMVVAEQQPSGRMRYRLLESVAAYCLERRRPAGDVLSRRDAYYAGLAERADLHGPGQRRWLRRLDEEWPNLRAVLDHSRDPELAVRVAWYWYLRGRHREGHRHLAAVREHPEAAAWLRGFALLTGAGRTERDRTAGTLASPRARWFLALAHLHLGAVAAGQTLIDGALADFRATGDRWGEAAALAARAKQALFQGDLDLAERSGTASHALFTALGDRWGQLQATDMLGYLAEITGDYDRAALLHRDGLRGAEDLQLWVDVSYRLSSLGRIALLTGDFARAREFHERGLRLAAEQSSRFAEEFARVGLALAARRSGDLDGADALLRESLAWSRRLEDEDGVPFYGVTLLLSELGFVAEQRGDAAGARSLHQEGLAAAEAIGDPRAVALAHEGLAGAAALEGSFAAAERLLATAAALREAAGAPLPPAERGDVERITARIRAAVR